MPDDTPNTADTTAADGTLAATGGTMSGSSTSTTASAGNTGTSNNAGTEAGGTSRSDTFAAGAQSLKDGAANLGKDASAKVRSLAEDGKVRAGGALDELSRLLGDAATTVDEKVGTQYGQYARNAAEAVSGFSDQIKTKDLDELVADARAFVQKSPAIAIGTAAALGFVLMRLIKSGVDANDRA